MDEHASPSLRPAPHALRRSSLGTPGFRRLVVAWTFSNFGDSALYLTLAIWIKDLTGSDAAAGIVFLFLGLPAFLAPVAGHIADRFSRRRLVVIANLVSALGVLSLALVRDASDVWIVYVVTFGYGLLTYLTSACASGLIKDLVPDVGIAAANGLLATIDQGLRLLSPLAGAGLYAAFGGTAVGVLTAGTLIIAALVVSTIRMVETPPTPVEERRAFAVEFTAGFHHLRTTPGLARSTLLLAIAFGFAGMANTAIFALVEEGLGRSPAFFAVIAAIQGLGSIGGGITASMLIGRLGERMTLSIGLLVLGAGIATMLAARTTVVGIGALGVGVGIPWAFVSYVTLRQRATPAELQGRVSAASNLALSGPQTVGTALGAALIAVVDYRIIATTMSVVMIACGALARRGAEPPIAAADTALAVSTTPRNDGIAPGA